MVYVIHKKDYFDLKSAEDWGNIHVVYDGNNIPDLFNIGKICYELKDVLKNFSKRDYLVLSGNIVVNAIALAIALRAASTVNILLFNSLSNAYTPRTINAYQIEMGGKDDRE